MMNRPKISVIIPTFNSRRTLEAAIRSVSNQTFSVHELLVIDGGSSDGTLDVIKANEKNITYWISQKDKGVYDAINKGILRATGEWIYVLGSDDTLASADVLESAASQISDSISLLFGSIRNLNIKHRLIPEVHMSSMGSGLYLRNTLHQQSAFYRKSLFEKEMFDSALKVLADYDFHLLLFKQKVAYKSVDLMVAECEASGLSKQFTSSLYVEEFRLKRKRMGLLYALLMSPIIATKFVLKQLR
jgi:glycosyltransferase involved in cell wall biosynthesis